MHLRPTTIQDCDLLAELHRETFTEKWDASAFRELFESGTTAGLIAECERRSCGFIVHRIVADEAEILTLAVRPKARRKGIAQALLKLAGQVAWDRGARALFLEVDADNHFALRLYGKLGFREVGRRKAYYQIDGHVHDALVLRSALPLSGSAWEVQPNSTTVEGTKSSGKA